MSKPTRLNLCSPVRTALIERGYSSVKVVNAVNGALKECELAEATQKTADSSIAKKSATFKVRVSVSEKYESKLTVPLLFDVWHGRIAKAEEVAHFESVQLPKRFDEWLDKFAKANEADKAAEKLEVNA